MVKGRPESIELPEVLQEEGQGNGLSKVHYALGQDGDGIIYPAYQKHEAYSGPRGDLGPVPEDEDQYTHQHPDHCPVEKQAEGKDKICRDSRDHEVEIKEDGTRYREDDEDY